MSRKELSRLAVLACCATSAHADPLAVTTTGTMPFSRAELETALALRARLATTSTAPRIDARVAGNGQRIRIDVIGRQRTVALDGQRGADAARLVAFAILDVAGAQLDPPVAPPAPPLSKGAAPATTTPVAASQAAATIADGTSLRATRPDANNVAAPPAVAAAPDDGDVAMVVDAPASSSTAAPDSHWSVALWGVSGSRSFGALEVGAPIAGRLRAVASAGVGLDATMTAGGQTIDVRVFPARVALGARVAGLELRVGAVGIVEHASSSTRASTDVIAGGGAAAVYAVPLTRGFGLLAGGGADVFVTSLDYRVNGVHVATTDRIAWWAGLALAREARW